MNLPFLLILLRWARNYQQFMVRRVFWNWFLWSHLGHLLVRWLALFICAFLFLWLWDWRRLLNLRLFISRALFSAVSVDSVATV